jgi:hypothetical protein
VCVVLPQIEELNLKVQEYQKRQQEEANCRSELAVWKSRYAHHHIHFTCVLALSPPYRVLILCSARKMNFLALHALVSAIFNECRSHLMGREDLSCTDLFQGGSCSHTMICHDAHMLLYDMLNPDMQCSLHMPCCEAVPLQVEASAVDSFHAVSVYPWSVEHLHMTHPVVCSCSHGERSKSR